MKRFCIFLSLMVATLMSLASCATKRKTKDVEQVKVEAKTEVKNDSVLKILSKTSKLEANQAFNEFESILKALNVSYDGDQGNELNVTLNHTEKGTELNVKGKGKANYNEQSEKTYNLTKSDILAIYDSLKQAELKQNKVERGQLLVDSFKRDKENDTTGFQFGAYLTGFGVLCLIIFLTWISRKFINKK
ncbi:hypothetical protein ACTS93_02630 [Empedobacter falsenii]